MFMSLESLENRTLMSASLSKGVLNVLGSAVADVITVSQTQDKIRVTENGVTSNFKVSKVKSIVVDGAGGDDRIVGDSTLTKGFTARGGEGSDTFVSGPKADVFEGGAGTDTADYSARTTGQVVSLDDVANDGSDEEKDNIKSDVENVKTGSGNDVVTGSALANSIETNDGFDTVNAGDGPDTVQGGYGNDVLNGESGADLMYGNTMPVPVSSSPV
jgi:Ca2+-binding RTX toxin-like protein